MIEDSYQREFREHMEAIERGYQRGVIDGHRQALIQCYELALGKTKNDYLQNMADKIEKLSE